MRCSPTCIRSASTGTTRSAARASCTALPRAECCHCLRAKSRSMSNPYKGRTGLDRIVRAMGYSLDGLRIAYHGESAFRQEIWLAVVLLPAAFWLGRSWIGVALLAGTKLDVVNRALLGK